MTFFVNNNVDKKIPVNNRSRVLKYSNHFYNRVDPSEYDESEFLIVGNDCGEIQLIHSKLGHNHGALKYSHHNAPITVFK